MEPRTGLLGIRLCATEQSLNLTLLLSPHLASALEHRPELTWRESAAMRTIDAASFPHIIDEILDSVKDAPTLKILRLVNHDTRQRIDSRLKRHLLLRYDGVRSRLGGVRWEGVTEEDDPSPTYVDIDARMTIVGASTSKLVHDFENVQQTLSSFVSTQSGPGVRIIRGRMTELYPQSDEPARCVVLFFDTYPLALYHTVAHLQDSYAEEAIYHFRYDPAFRAVNTSRVQSVSTITAFPKRSTFLFTPVSTGRKGHSPNCQQCAGSGSVRILDHVLSHIVPDWIFNQGHRYRFVGTDEWSLAWISSELVAPSGTVWASAPPLTSVKDAILWMLGELSRHASGMYDAGEEGEQLMQKLENAVSFLSLQEYEEELGPEDFAVVTAAPGAEFELDATAQSRPNGHSRPVWPR